MKYLYSLLLIILFLNLSCKRTNTTQEVSENTDSLKINPNRIVNSIGEILIPKAKNEVAEWEEYRNVDEFMMKYYNISNMEALDNAKELSELVQLMKDSIRIKKLKELYVVARFNVLHNETLRLADMATIPSISSEEVKEEVGKIVEVFSSLNSKINTIYKAEELQKRLEVDTEITKDINEEPEFIESINIKRRKSPVREKYNEEKPNILKKPIKERSKPTLIAPKKELDEKI